MQNWMAMEENVFLNERLNSVLARARFLGVSTARIVVVFLQGRWMKRKVNECGERTGPLWLCVSLISSWWEAIWGRDGAYYCDGTLRTRCEALFVCLVWGQQCSRYKHVRQHMKRNHYSTKEEKKIHTRVWSNSRKGWTFATCSTHISSIPLPPTHLCCIPLHPPDWVLCFLFALFFSICLTHSSLLLHLSLLLCLVSFLAVCVSNLVGGWHDEHSHVSRWELKGVSELTLHA